MGRALMIHAASMLAGLAIVWLVLSLSLERAELAAGAVSVSCSALIAHLLGCLDREAAPYLGLARRAPLAVQRLPAVLRESLRAMGAVFSPLKPGLVRMRTRPASDIARASVARALSASPGLLVVEADDDTLLLHVNDEDRFDPGEAIVIEASVLAALDGRQ
jgi:multisubunit Na+/H+ antiporter MnhE subunit